MFEVSALKVAIDLVHVPSRARLIKAAPLPDGMLALLLIAADDEAAQGDGVEATGRTREVVKGAAAFFIEQVLLSAESDSYRVLGARETATNAELRRNMALLLKALHPDLDQNKDRAMFAGRVTRAWEDLKTPDRRDAYDRARRLLGSASGIKDRKPGPIGMALKSKIKQRARGADLANNHATVRRPSEPGRSAHTGFIRRAWIFFLGSNKT